MKNIIIKHLDLHDLDIRKHHDARFMDQKCTPDVICFIADCVINTIPENNYFSVKDIWNSQYFIKNTRAIFNKPWATDKKAQHEYDKFIQQPLRMLAHAHVLEISKHSNFNIYRVVNGEILDYIAQRERNTFVFLYFYLKKVLSDSGFWPRFIEFSMDQQTNQKFQTLKNNFDKFLIGNTSINTKVEVHRIFPKILNILAVEHNIQGTIKGHLSRYPFTFSDLMYNRKNWRDLNKDKTVTRQEAIEDKAENDNQEIYNAYYVQKAAALIRKIQTKSEVHDQWENGEATQVHHIFPRSEFQSIAHYIENLILLTATQHNTKAHPCNNTQTISRDYQLTCLLAKADTIDKSLKKYGERYYRKESFIYVIKVGLSQDIDMSFSFADIKTKLIHIYNEV